MFNKAFQHWLAWTPLLAAVLSLFPWHATKADNDWINTGTGSWFTATNWSSGVVPDSDDYPTIDNGGTAVVDNSGTQATASILYVGDTATGALIVNNGGSLASTLSTIGVHAGGEGVVTVNNGNWSVADQLQIGYLGSGTLNITGSSGGVSDAYGLLGSGAGSSGTAVVSGGNWNNWQLDIGNMGRGDLTIKDAGSVTCGVGNINIGYATGSEGNATIESGSMSTSGDLNVALGGAGTLKINGGQVSDDNGYIGKGSAATATVNGGTWTNSELFVVGFSSHGNLIMNGGDISAAACYLGFVTGSSGNATIAGGTLSSGNIFIGTNGTGSLTLSGSGTVTTGNTVILADGTDGTLQIGDGGAFTGAFVAPEVFGKDGGGGTASVIFEQNNNYTFAPKLTGNLGVTQNGTGTTTLSGNNDYTNGTTINSGTLSIASSTGLGRSTGNLTLNGGILQTTVSMSGSWNTTISASTGTFEVTAGTLTHGGTISGPGALIKTGAGTLVLSGTNTYAGETRINEGTISIASSDALGSSTGTLIFDNGTLKTTASLNGNWITTLSAGGGTFDVAAGTLTYNGSINGSGRLTKTGTGTLEFSASTFYTGGTTIRQGAISIASDNSLGDSAGDLVFDGGTLQTTATMNTSRATTIEVNGGTFQVTTGTLTHGGAIEGGGTLRKTGAGTLVLSGSNTNSGGTAIDGGMLSVASNAALGHNSGDLSFNGGTLQTTATMNMNRATALNADGGTFDVTTGTVTQGGTISGLGKLTKEGAGTLTLSASNSYSGGTEVSGGELVADHNHALGSGAVTISEGKLLVKSGISIANSVKLAGGTYAREVNGSLAGTLQGESELGGNNTGFELLGGETSSATILESSFSSTSSAFNDEMRLSDVLHFEGTGSDLFVLQLTVDGVTSDSILGWMNGGNEWINAVDGNLAGSNNATLAMQGFAGSFAEFQSLHGLILSDYVGAYGVDEENDSVWGVLNHNSEFAVIPEPSTAALLVLGTLLFLRRVGIKFGISCVER